MLQNIVDSRPAKFQLWHFAVVSCSGQAFYTLFDRYDADLSGLTASRPHVKFQFVQGFLGTVGTVGTVQGRDQGVSQVGQLAKGSSKKL